MDYQRTLRPFLEKLQNRVIQPDWVERIVTHRASLVAFTIVCTTVTIAAFPMGVIIGFNLFGVTEFFLLNTILPAFLLMVISANLAGYGVWNLWNRARMTQPQEYTGRAGLQHTAMPVEQDLLTVGAKATDAPPALALVVMTHVVYALLALTLVTSLSAILAVVIHYVKHREARGTYLATHFRWQIQTFWFGLPLVMLGIQQLWFGLFEFMLAKYEEFPLLLLLPLVLQPALYIWVIYRIYRGWRALRNHEAIYSRRGNR